MPPKRKLKQVRVCLGCDKKFKSAGPHNRMCIACRNNQKLIDHDTHTISISPFYKKAVSQ